jgi:alanine racemase
LHLKIDALLGRQGLLVDELEAFAKAALAAPGVEVVSAYSHFANIEDTPDFAHAQAQIDIYHEGLAVLAAAGLPSLTPHLSSTSGVMAYEANAGSSPLVRCGIGTYGMYPSDALGARYQALKLEPAMRWVSHLAQVKTLPAGFPIGYGLTYVTKAQTPVGIVPQGYSDGYDRGLSNVGEVLVNGKRCRVLGRVAMNMFAVDLTNASRARQEDEVVLLGAQGADRISAEEVAERIGTINYEITTRVSALLPRVVV